MILPFDAVGEGPVVVLLHAGIADRTASASHGVGPASRARTSEVEAPGPTGTRIWSGTTTVRVGFGK